MRANFLFTACVIFFLAVRCPAGRVADDPAITPVSGELLLLDPANGDSKSLLKLEGEALGKPVVADKTLYVASSQSLYALDARTGEKNWEVALTAIAGIAATPQKVFVGSAGTLIALDSAGKVLWTYKNDIAIDDPTLADGLIVFNSIDGPIAVDQQTGKLRWRLAMQWGYFVFSPLSEGRLCVWKPDEICVVETEHGKTLWQSSADESISAPGALPTPAVAAGDLICQLRGSPKDADDWSLQTRDAGSGRMIGKTPLGQHEAVGVKTMILDKTAYCVLQDNLSAVDVAGGKLKWQTVIAPMEAGRASLLAAHGLLYIPELDGEITALDETTGTAKWVAAAPKPSPGGKIRVGGMCVSDAGVYITRNDQTRQ